MNLSLAKFLRTAVDNNCDDVQYRHNYSGRGMYGKRCVGITGGRIEVQKILADVMHQIMDAVVDSQDAQVREEARDVIDVLMDYRSDNMAHDIIIYWPNVEDIDENGDMFEVDEEDEDL